MMNDENIVNTAIKRPLSPDTKLFVVKSQRRIRPKVPSTALKNHDETVVLPLETLPCRESHTNTSSSPSKSAAPKPTCTTNKRHCLGLLRVAGVSCPTTNSLATDSMMTIPVFPGAVLGRSVGKNNAAAAAATTAVKQPILVLPLPPVPKRQHLGIDAKSAPGVSRKQLFVLHATQTALRVYQPSNVANPVAISRYSATSHTMKPVMKLSKNDTIDLYLGDTVIFDFCRVTPEQPRAVGPPQHVFRVVKIEEALSATTTTTDAPLATSLAALTEVRNMSSSTTTMTT